MADAHLEEAGRVAHDARVEAHDLEPGEHLVHLRRALHGEDLYCIGVWTGCGPVSGIARRGCRRGRCGRGRGGGWCSTPRGVEAHLCLGLDTARWAAECLSA